MRRGMFTARFTALALALILIALVVSPLVATAAPKLRKAPFLKSPNMGVTDRRTVNTYLHAFEWAGRAHFAIGAIHWLNSINPSYNLQFADLEAQMVTADQLLGQSLEVLNTNRTASLQYAKQSTAISQSVYSEAESRINAVGRSLGEYRKLRSDLKVLVFGSDWPMIGGTAMILESWGIETDVAYDQWMTTIDLSEYDVLVFDPEYRLYGVQAGTGIPWLGGQYGGLSPQENAYLESRVSAGLLGLIYMEPYPVWPNGGYCRYGQIPFLPINFNGNWIAPFIPVPVNIADSSHPIANGLPGTFNVESYGQWDGVDLMANPSVSNKVVVANSVGPAVVAFNYGSGRGVLLSSDTLTGNLFSRDWSKLLRNATLWAGNR